jgi:hypothetical protein
MWIGLVFVACLGSTDLTPAATSAPRQCRKIELSFEGSMMQCMLLGQQGIVNWLSQNDQWVLTGGYKCMTGKPA